jgi:hypothetical protein
MDGMDVHFSYVEKARERRRERELSAEWLQLSVQLPGDINAGFKSHIFPWLLRSQNKIL